MLIWIQLHLRADEGEDAAIFIEPHTWGTETNAAILLGNDSHVIASDGTTGMIFTTPQNKNFAFMYGKVGIGTKKPKFNLHVEGSLFTKQFTLIEEHTEPQKGFVLVSDREGKGSWIDPSGFSVWKANQNNETDIYYTEGNVGIGAINTHGYRLAVNGKILTDEVMVKHVDTWPDYVLDENYKLMPLFELEEFINNNSHLPDVPSEADVKKDGYGLAEMNEILLKKIEELTLYIIEQQKAMEVQQGEIEKMKDFIGLTNN